jgi:uridylate kinase
MPSATFFPRITYLDILNRGLKVMDSTAISLCMDNRLPLVVFNVGARGNLLKVVQGEEWALWWGRHDDELRSSRTPKNA